MCIRDRAASALSNCFARWAHPSAFILRIRGTKANDIQSHRAVSVQTAGQLVCGCCASVRGFGHALSVVCPATVSYTHLRAHETSAHL
eukprot:8475356-Alexandrium_andersonii.AAC.1